MTKTVIENKPKTKTFRNSKEVSAIFNKDCKSSLTWSETCRFAKNVGIPKQITTDYLELIAKWIVCSGPEWTCKRIKDIKTSIVHWYAHGKEGKPSIPWVRKTRYGNHTGVIQSLINYCTSDKQFTKVVRLLTIASAFMSSSPTKSQVEKFIGAVETTIGPEEYDKSYQTLLNRGASLLRHNKWLPSEFPKGEDLLHSAPLKEAHENKLLAEWIWDISRGPAKTLLSGKRDEQGLVIQQPAAWFTKMLSENSLWNYLDFDDEFYYPFEGDKTPVNVTHLFDELAREYSGSLQPEVVGTVCCTQEPGFKLRCYAAPHLWIQVILEPLKQFLMNTLKKLPWDMTHDQRKMDFWIQAHLEYGEKVFCYDLSNASDLIPLNSQLEILRYIIPSNKHHYIDAMDWVSHQQWWFPTLERTISWNRGQALGSGPSFGSFALWHGLLLWSLSDFNHDDLFYIVGDDVVILDPTLAEKYEKALEAFKLPWSKQKTLQSSQVAEFTGYLFTAKGSTKIPKWKKFTQDNFLANLYNQGPKFMNFVPKDNREAVEQLAALPYPWGFGWNPKGLTLEERLKGAYEILITEKPQPDLLVRTKVLRRNRLQALDKWYLRSVFEQTITNSYQRARLSELDAREYSQAIQFIDELASLPKGRVYDSYLSENSDWEDMANIILKGIKENYPGMVPYKLSTAQSKREKEIMNQSFSAPSGRVTSTLKKISKVHRWNLQHEAAYEEYLQHVQSKETNGISPLKRDNIS